MYCFNCRHYGFGSFMPFLPADITKEEAKQGRCQKCGIQIGSRGVENFHHFLNHIRKNSEDHVFQVPKTVTLPNWCPKCGDSLQQDNVRILEEA